MWEHDKGGVGRNSSADQAVVRTVSSGLELVRLLTEGS